MQGDVGPGIGDKLIGDRLDDGRVFRVEPRFHNLTGKGGDDSKGPLFGPVRGVILHSVFEVSSVTVFWKLGSHLCISFWFKGLCFWGSG